MSELKKCPFCNKELEQKGNFFYKHPTDGKCILSNFSVCNRLKDIEAWNRRIPVDDVVEALEEKAEGNKKLWDELDAEDAFGGMNAYMRAIQIVKEMLNE